MFRLDSFKANFNSLTLKEKGLVSFIILDLLLLLVLGRAYTKNSFYPYLYYHDVFLLVTLLYSLTFKSTFRLKSIEIICLLSIAYLAVSFLINIHPDNNLYIYLRQFMIFGYLIQSYFIFKAVAGFKNGTQVLIQVLTFFAVIAVALQIIYILYILFALEENPFLKRNYFSPIVVLGVITTTSLFLTYLNGYKKILIFILTLMISLSIGHDSAYLAVICIFLLSYFFNASFKIKILVSTLAIFGGIALYFFVAPFTDINAHARLFYWNDVFIRIIKDGSILYGNGFGKPYLSNESAQKLNDIVLVFKSPNSHYLVAPHNSFLTLIYHIGISALLLLYPLRKMFYSKRNLKNNQAKYLLLSLTGVAVWASFNVILELPHSSSYFWLIYFTLAFYFYKINLDDKKEVI